jgi:hypothetical protein
MTCGTVDKIHGTKVPRTRRRKIKKSAFFVWLLALYLRNSYFWVSKPLSRALLCISKKVSTFAADFDKTTIKNNRHYEENYDCCSGCAEFGSLHKERSEVARDDRWSDDGV